MFILPQPVTIVDNRQTISASEAPVTINSDISDFEAYLQEFPEGRFAAIARLKIKQLEKKQTASVRQSAASRPKTPQPQLMKWGLADGYKAGICVGTCEEIIPRYSSLFQKFFYLLKNFWGQNSFSPGLEKTKPKRR